MGSCSRTTIEVCYRKRSHLQHGFKRKARLREREISVASTAWSRLRVVVWSFAAVRWNARITATDHLDRERGILRGCLGEVIGWIWPKDVATTQEAVEADIWNETPACILVRFQTKEEWQVNGLQEKNVFPVATQKKPWYLDKGRSRPVLRVTRKQFPLAPAFATTAHAVQGQTCPQGVVTDMHIGEAGDPLTVYIVL